MAMQLDPLNAVLPANRAMALLKQEKYVAAEEDCSTALALDSHYVKAYFRRGSARVKLGKLAEAKEDFEEVIRLDPRNEHAKTEIERIEKVTDGISLLTAAQRGQDNIVQKLLQKGTNPNFQDKDGMSSLMFAAQNCHEDVLQLLLKAGANLNLQDKDKASALFFAVEGGHENIVQLLLYAKANPNLPGMDGHTVLMAAAFSGHYRMVELLLENGADLNYQNKFGFTALTTASLAGHQRVVELLKTRADLKLQRRPAISVTTEKKQLAPALQMSMQDIPEQQKNHREDTETTRSSQSAELDISVMTEEEQLALALQMSMQGIPEQQHHNVATETDERSQSAKDGMSLVTAAQCGQDNIVQKLLQKGANPNFQDEDGNTALIAASGKGHLRVVEILLENGADLNLKTKGGMTACDIARQEGYAELCQVLLQHS